MLTKAREGDRAVEPDASTATSKASSKVVAPAGGRENVREDGKSLGVMYNYNGARSRDTTRCGAPTFPLVFRA